MTEVETILGSKRSLLFEQPQIKTGAYNAAAKRQTYTRKFLLVVEMCLVWMSAGLASLAIAYGTNIHSAARQTFFRFMPIGFDFLFATLVVLFGDLRGLYELPWKRSLREDLLDSANAVTSAVIVTATGLYLGVNGAGSLGTLALTAALSWLSIAAWRSFVRSLSIPGLAGKRNVLIVGYGPIAHLLQQHLAENDHLGLVVKGFVSRRKALRGPGGKAEDTDYQLLGTVDELSTIARAHFIDEIIISLPSDRHLVKEIARKAQAAGVQVRVLPDLYDGLASEQPVEYLGEFPTLTLSKREAPIVPLMIKRLIDLVGSSLGLLVLAPFFAVIAIIIKLDSEGPVFFRSVTAGRKGVTMVCYKFRTMVANADSMKKSLAHLNERDGVFFKIARDPRITRVGRVLRKFSIDELPELWNVFKGEMSLVGPRPPACGEFTKYSLEHLCRLDVTPGLTCLWQVTARRDPSFSNCVELDREYVRNWSLGLDFKILWKTIGVVLAGTGE
jgi:exopolysaccharide biosynthesis polyprenyl glycosylphosphotransferase